MSKQVRPKCVAVPPERPPEIVREDIAQLLGTLQLHRIKQVLNDELEYAQRESVSYSEFLARLLREQYLYKQQRQIAYRFEQAKLPEQWALETFPFERQPEVRAQSIRQLAELDFVPKAENVLFIGPTGVGKTGLAISIMRKALENGYRGLFIRAQELFEEMYASLADRSTRKLIERLMRIDLLLIDEMGYINLRPEQSNIFFRLMEERYRRKATIITTNLATDEWYAFLGNKQMVDALLNRFCHYCHTVSINGPSLRDPLYKSESH